MKNYIYIPIIYIIAVTVLSLTNDIFAIFAFPSFPFLIRCFENCGYLKGITAIIVNGLILGVIVVGINRIRGKN